MSDLDDLQLNESRHEPSVPEPPRSGSSWLIATIVIAAILGIGLAVLLWHRPTPAPAATPTAAVPPPAKPVPTTTPPTAVAPEDVTVPPLDESDPIVRQLVSALSSHPRIAAWLATDGLLRNAAVVIGTIAEGNTPEKPLLHQRPSAPFAVKQGASGTVIDPASYHRYDGYADAVAGLDARATARVYETLKPRLQEAYNTLGYPNPDVDAGVRRAVVTLLNAPVIDGEIAVTRTSVNWQYADPALESLPAAERQLIRMGPRNERLIQAKLREIAPYIGIDLSRQ